MHRISLFVFFLSNMMAVSLAHAESWVLPPPDIDLFGQIRTIKASREETLLDIARRYDIGQIEILLANPQVDRWLPADGAEVILPSRYIIPPVERKGIVLNLAEMRLYYFPESIKGQKPRIITYPVGIGRMDWLTPLGVSKIVDKKKDPSWTPPQSIRNDRLANGEPPLPDVVPPGPDNPLGRHALRLNITKGSYLIHGTVKPFGVGMRVSAGCVRMYPEDIEALFDKVPTGTPVHIINQPIKVGWIADSLYIELHPPLEEEEEKYADYRQIVMATVSDFLTRESHNKNRNIAANIQIDHNALKKAILEKNGIPVLISRTEMP